MDLLFLIEYRDTGDIWVYVETMNYFMVEEIIQILDTWNPRSISTIKAIKVRSY